MARRMRIPEHPSPFQSLILVYMREHWPMDMADLADQLEMPYNTVHGWFAADRVPHVSSLRQIAEHTDIPLGDLYHAAGYDTPPPSHLRGHDGATAEQWSAMERYVRDFPGLDPLARHAWLEMVRAIRRGQVDQFAAQRAAEHTIVEVTPAPMSAPATDSQSESTSPRDNATTTQHEQPKQATRTARRRRRDVAHQRS